MRSRYASTCFSVCVFMFSIAFGAFAENEPEETVAEFLPQSPIAYLSNGTVISFIEGFGDILAYDLATDSTKVLYRTGQANVFGRNSTQFEVAGDASNLTLIDFDQQGQSRIKLVELNRPGFPVHSIPETRLTNVAPRLSPDGQLYAFSGRLDPQVWGAEALWSFNLGEYLWDVSQGAAQPTGFYSTSVYVPPPRDPQGFGGSNQIPSLAWSPDGTEIAYLISTFDNRGATSSLKVYNLITQQTREVGAATFGGRMEWAQPGSLYFLQNQGAAGPIFKMDMERGASESVLNDAVEPSTLSFSPNGKWMAYSLASGTPPARGTAWILDLSQKKPIRLKGASGARFGTDSETLVLARADLDLQKQEKPFWVVKLSELVAAASNNVVDLAPMAKEFTLAGASIPAFAPPEEKAEFEKRFALEKFQFQQSGQYVTSTGDIVNKSDKFYSITMPSFDIARCTVTDDTGTVLGASFSNPRPPGQVGKNIVGPGKKMGIYCTVYLPAVPPIGTKAKYVLQLNGYEKQMTLERDITF